ncbi:ABC transporter substrate-binding protein [Paenibacillus sambharensis]|uniref:ABC transporter substrate-binding protein n=1 Tax=Paenibacillus sambharensis TaxID=1803190 RepID=A0A2W1LIZ0_9BACL|nr:ABC transporter substrate-binding protein [Paenibacillus sambharensis]PZD95042.1 ABC transporter substrate-binding protein [Paenibacillus sambharensis]
MVTIKKAWLTCVGIGLLAAVLAGCGSPEKPASETDYTQAAAEVQSITIKDSIGKEFVFNKPAERVIVLNRNAAEAMKLLQVEDKLVGVGDQTHRFNSYLGLQELPDVGKTNEVSFETIISLQPEVVVAFTNRPSTELESKLEPAGIQVVRLDLHKPDTYTAEFGTLAKMMGAEKRAEEFIRWKEEIEATLAERVQQLKPEDKKRGMAISAGALNTGNYNVFTSRVGEGQGILMAGGVSLDSGLEWDPQSTSTTVKVNAEYVVKENPDFVVLNSSSFGGYDVAEPVEAKAAIDMALKQSVISETNAGKTGQVYFFQTNLLGSDRTYIGAMYLAKHLYPDLFRDIQPETYAREYFESWLDVPFKGTWLYPTP